MPPKSTELTSRLHAHLEQMSLSKASRKLTAILGYSVVLASFLFAMNETVIQTKGTFSATFIKMNFRVVMKIFSCCALHGLLNNRGIPSNNSQHQVILLTMASSFSTQRFLSSAILHYPSPEFIVQHTRLDAGCLRLFTAALIPM